MLAGLLAGAVFLGLYFFILPANLVVSLVSSLAAFGAGLLLTGKRQNQIQGRREVVSEDYLNRVLDAGENKLAELQSIIPQLLDSKIRDQANLIAGLVKKIIDDIEADPTDLEPASKFFAQYLDATLGILSRYLDISQRGIGSPETTAAVAKVETVLNTIRQAFEKQLDKLLENDVIGLEVEIQMLEETLIREGLQRP